MPKFIYISIPRIHTTATLERQKQHLLDAAAQADRGNTPPLSPDKHKLFSDINAELATRG